MALLFSSATFFPRGIYSPLHQTCCNRTYVYIQCEDRRSLASYSSHQLFIASFGGKQNKLPPTRIPFGLSTLHGKCYYHCWQRKYALSIGHLSPMTFWCSLISETTRSDAAMLQISIVFIDLIVITSW